MTESNRSRGPYLPGLQARWKKSEGSTSSRSQLQEGTSSTKVARLDLADLGSPDAVQPPLRTERFHKQGTSSDGYRTRRDFNPRPQLREGFDDINEGRIGGFSRSSRSRRPSRYEYRPSFLTYETLSREDFRGNNFFNEMDEWDTKPEEKIEEQDEIQSPKKILRKPRIPESSQCQVDPDVAKFLKRISSSFTDAFINSGLFEAHHLSESSLDFKNIQRYVRNGQCYDGFGIRLLNVLEVAIRNKSWELDPNTGSLKQMLFHGTHLDKIPSILEYGLQCPDSWKQDQRFGQGIYFSDRIGKCAHFTFSDRPRVGEIHYVLLCEVRLGRVFTVVTAEGSQHQYNTAPPALRTDSGAVMQYDSVMCRGRQVPDPRHYVTIGDVLWPLGPTVDNPDNSSKPMVKVNEFVVYKPEQIKVRYIVEVEITDSHC